MFWVVGANIRLYAAVPAFNMVVGTWKALLYSVVSCHVQRVVDSGHGVAVNRCRCPQNSQQ